MYSTSAGDQSLPSNSLGQSHSPLISAFKSSKPKTYNPFLPSNSFKASSLRSEPVKEDEKRETSGYLAPSGMSPLVFNSSINKNSNMKKNLNIEVSQPSFNYFSKTVAHSQPQTTLASSSLSKLANARTNPLNNFKKEEPLLTDAIKPIVKSNSNTPLIETRKEAHPNIHENPPNFKSNSFVGVFPNRVSPSNKNLYNNSFATPQEKKFEFLSQAVVLPNQEPTKFSVKKNGVVKAYAANTNQGIVRNYNEDRVSIILNIMKPNNRGEENWPKCSFFGVYDGHGGTLCADYLRDLLHQYVIKDPNFPNNPKEALRKGFELAEKNFFSFYCENMGTHEKSGSCAIVVLIVGDMCYVANVGDSRAVMSGEGGSKVYPLSRDHKPLDELENKRIIEAGGKIYQTKASANTSTNGESKANTEMIVGPYRVFPGRLSVTRTFGDVEAKDTRFGGNPNVVIAVPDIKSFKITKDHDFIVLGSDGIFDKLSSKEVVQCVWESTSLRQKNIHEQCAKGVEGILKEAIFKKTIDNITVVVIGFSNFKKKIFPRLQNDKEAPQKSSSKAIDGNSSKETTNLNLTSTNQQMTTEESTFNSIRDLKKQESNLVASTTSNINNVKIHPDETNEKNLHSALEKTIKTPFNPYIGSPLAKNKPEYLNTFKLNTSTMTPSFKTSKLEAFKRTEREKPADEKDWEAKKDHINSRNSLKE